MPVQFQCPNCKRTLTAPDHAVGKRAKCSRCGNAIIVPNSDLFASSSGSFPQDEARVSAVSPAPSRPSTDKVCPYCRFPMASDAVVCVECGYSDRTEQQLRTVEDTEDTPRSSSPASDTRNDDTLKVSIRRTLLFAGLAILFHVAALACPTSIVALKMGSLAKGFHLQVLFVFFVLFVVLLIVLALVLVGRIIFALVHLLTAERRTRALYSLTGSVSIILLWIGIYWSLGWLEIFFGSGRILQTYTAPESSAEDEVGTSVAGFDDRIVVAEDEFGTSVAGFDDRIVVGASKIMTISAGKKGRTVKAGRAVFVFDALSGKLLLTLKDPGHGGGGFGECVATMGNNVLIGSRWQHAPRGTGVVYVFDGLTGKLVRTMNNPGSRVCGFFGTALATSENRVAVSAPDDNVVYLFNGITNELLLRLHAPHPTEKNVFGKKLALAGERVLVAAPNSLSDKTADTEDTGEVHVFDGRKGRLLFTLRSPAPHTAGFFGRDVSALGKDFLIADWGVVYLFDGSSGTLLREFHSPRRRKAGGFGSAVTSVRNHAMITAAGENAVYVFDGADGKLVKTVRPSMTAGVEFGWHIVPLGGNVVVSGHTVHASRGKIKAVFLLEGISGNTAP
jgi:DNA-binding beta-propeller fold protein YncE